MSINTNIYVCYKPLIDCLANHKHNSTHILRNNLVRDGTINIIIVGVIILYSKKTQ